MASTKGSPFSQWARTYHLAGRRQEAEICYRLAVEYESADSGLFNDLGVLLREKGDLDEAACCFRRAIHIESGNARAYHNLGNVLNDLGNKEGAFRCYQKALELDPSEKEFFKAAGNILRELGRTKEAFSLFEEAQSLFPNDPEIFFGMGAVLKDLGRLAESVACYRAAIAGNPDLAEAHYNLGNVLLRMHRLEEAESSFKEAIRLKPDFAEAYNNLGTTCKEKNDIPAAIRMFQKAVELKRDFPEASWNLGLAHLLLGEFLPGWEGYERRWEKADYTVHRRPFAQPQWQGEDLCGRTLLLHAEQGFGDAIQFVRYLPLVASLGGRIVLECPGELKALFRSLPGAEAVIGRGEPLPAFDLHCPLMSLPALFRTELDTIPNRVPYLFPDPTLVKVWQRRVAAFTKGLRVGLVWAGNPEHLNDQNRSIPFELLHTLLEIQDVHFYSLQKGRRPIRAEGIRPVIDLTDEIGDFSDTAALIENLDLVIAVDTAVAHLAGALGKKVWTLLPFSPDWRWLLDRTDSPWYPTMRLYRQRRPGNWPEVLEKVREDLRGLVVKAGL